MRNTMIVTGCTVHEFLAGAEERGGEIEQSIELLVEDIEVWKRQTYELQKNKKTHQTECILSIVVAALVCGADMYIMEKVKSMAYAGGDIYDISTVSGADFFIGVCVNLSVCVL